MTILNGPFFLQLVTMTVINSLKIVVNLFLEYPNFTGYLYIFAHLQMAEKFLGMSSSLYEEYFMDVRLESNLQNR